jgi:hypothetical protein
MFQAARKVTILLVTLSGSATISLSYVHSFSVGLKSLFVGPNKPEKDLNIVGFLDGLHIRLGDISPP